MRIRSITLSLAGLALVCAFAVAQDSKPELPSAPSATVQQSKTPPKAQPPVKDSKPADSGTAGSQIGAPAESQAASPAPQAEESAPPDDTVPTIRTTVNEVNVIFTVTDKKGRYITDLKRDDFRVIDDGRPADEIRSFHRETNLPLQVGLLVDASNSVRDRFRFEQDSAIEFLNQTVRPRYDRAFIVGFDATPEVTQDFTDNTEQLSKGVRALRPGGGTAMYDALYYACRDKLGKEQQSGPVRRAIILLSDGDDNQSHVSREESIEMAQRADVIIYAISTNVTGSRNAGDKILQRIADATGGKAFFPFQITEVANAFSEIQDELRSQYALSYKPGAFQADGRYHTIEILAQNHKGLRVRTRHGYFAPSK